MTTQKPTTTPTPLPILGLLRLPQVCSLVGVKKTTVWAWVKDGRLPKPVKLSPRVTAWRTSEILAFSENAGTTSPQPARG